MRNNFQFQHVLPDPFSEWYIYRYVKNDITNQRGKTCHQFQNEMEKAFFQAP